MKTPWGETLCEELSRYLRDCKANGTLDALQKEWFDGGDLSAKKPADYESLSGEKGIIRLGTTSYPPFSVDLGDRFSGYEIQLITDFCREQGYGLEIVNMTPDAIIPSLQSGKTDTACCCITVTEERKESLLFTEPDYTGGTALLTAREEAAVTPEGFWESVAASFEKTFIREDRWMLFLEGIGTTLLITVLAVQDLTKMGDIVRSRTYETFFPLIAVAVIYFLLAGLLTALVKRIEFRTDPRRRTEEEILRGVDTHHSMEG